MSGCGQSVTLGNGTVETCGTRHQLGPELAPPLLCPTCQGRQALASVGLPLTASEFATLRQAATCEGCGQEPIARERPPYLGERCADEYARDLTALGYAESGSRCTAGCGYCGRCGGA